MAMQSMIRAMELLKIQYENPDSQVLNPDLFEFVVLNFVFVLFFRKRQTWCAPSTSRR